MNFIIFTNEIIYIMEEFNRKKEYLVQHSQILRKIKDHYNLNKDCSFLFINEVNYILKLSKTISSIQHQKLSIIVME